MEQDQIIFWTAFGAIGQAVGAIATAAAVIVALWATMSERTPKIKLRAGLRMIIEGDGSPATDAISINLANEGLRGVRVRSIGWETGWLRFGPSWLKRQYAHQTASTFPGSANPPFDLEPGQEATVLIEASVFANAQSENLRREFFNRKVPLRRDVVAVPVHVMAFFVGAKPVRSRAEKGLQRFLASGQIEADEGAAHFNAQAEKKRSDASKRK